jgi:hypothetical protein
LASIRDSFKWSKVILAALGAWAMTRIQSILGALEQIRRIIERSGPTCSVTIQKLNVLIVSIQVSLQRGILHLVWGGQAERHSFLEQVQRQAWPHALSLVDWLYTYRMDRYSLSASTPGATNPALMLLKVLGNCDACTKLIGYSKMKLSHDPHVSGALPNS